MTFGEKLKKLRTEKHLTQDELAERLYVTRTAVSKWESNRGYPNIDSLKAIAKCFSVTVDELLSSDEILTIAEEDHKHSKKHFRNLMYALFDLSSAMLLFLPFFAEKENGTIRNVSLVTLRVQPYLKTADLVFVIGMFLMGTLALALQSRLSEQWSKIERTISLALGTGSVLLFVISTQPYAAVFAFVLFAMKVFLLIKYR